MSDNQSIEPQTEETTAKERRDFLRNSVLAAGAVATFSVAESASAQTCYDAAGNIVKATSASTPQVIDVAFNSSDLVMDDLYSVIKQLGKLTGCLNCGFNGFDLRFRINPVIRLDTRIPAAATLMPR